MRQVHVCLGFSLRHGWLTAASCCFCCWATEDATLPGSGRVPLTALCCYKFAILMTERLLFQASVASHSVQAWRFNILPTNTLPPPSITNRRCGKWKILPKQTSRTRFPVLGFFGGRISPCSHFYFIVLVINVPVVELDELECAGHTSTLHLPEPSSLANTQQQIGCNSIH